VNGGFDAVFGDLNMFAVSEDLNMFAVLDVLAELGWNCASLNKFNDLGPSA
jgi:hypothetical protein